MTPSQPKQRCFSTNTVSSPSQTSQSQQIPRSQPPTLLHRTHYPLTQKQTTSRSPSLRLPRYSGIPTRSCSYSYPPSSSPSSPTSTATHCVPRSVPQLHQKPYIPQEDPVTLQHTQYHPFEHLDNPLDQEEEEKNKEQEESDYIYTAMAAPRASEQGPSSPCSPTSTTHLATPEWASPDLSFRNYLNQISDPTSEIHSNSYSPRSSSAAAVPRSVNWTKRSLSMSTLTPFPFSISKNTAKRSPLATTTATPNAGDMAPINETNVAIPVMRRFSTFPFNPKRQRQSISVTRASLPISEQSNEENNDNEDDYFTQEHGLTGSSPGSPLGSPTQQQRRRHSSSLKSLYISFPSIDDAIEGEEQDGVDGQENEAQLHQQQHYAVIV